MAGRRPSDQGTELNLIPVMNLMSVTIPFLVMGAQFVQYASIEGAMARIGATPKPGVEQPAPPAALAVRIDDEGLIVSIGAPGRSAASAALTRLPCRIQPCQGVEDYPWDGLVASLSEIKDQFPDETHVVLVPAEDTRYELLIRAMDTCREDRRVVGAPRPLFPQVAIAGGGAP